MERMPSTTEVSKVDKTERGKMERAEVGGKTILMAIEGWI